MPSPTKTYSGEQSYHEMLIRAQALSPVLTYLLCDLLLRTKINPKVLVQATPSVELHDDGLYADRIRGFGVYFERNSESSKMSQFLRTVFGGFTIHIGWTDSVGHIQHLLVDTPFVQWIQSGVVTMDESKQLVTINL